MQKISFNTGIEEFEINGGKVLRFNPADINVYKRLLDAQDKILDIETHLEEKASTAGESIDGGTVISLLAEADAEMKQILGEVFGNGNDFDDIFEGVNLMSPGNNGERVITNFLSAIVPILENGAKRAARAQAAEDVAVITGNRNLRQAQK